MAAIMAGGIASDLTARTNGQVHKQLGYSHKQHPYKFSGE